MYNKYKHNSYLTAGGALEGTWGACVLWGGGGGGAWLGGWGSGALGGGGGAWFGGFTTLVLLGGGGGGCDDGIDGGGALGRILSAGLGLCCWVVRLPVDAANELFKTDVILRTVPNFAAAELLLSGLWGVGERGVFMLCALLTGLPLIMSFFGGVAGFPEKIRTCQISQPEINF